ncbi:YicC family protein [Heliorestis acidaminivorans]|uniref:YicC family protein n=1 Tax=Heliorestis acidaminivorans TaxID=553427 RepID=A0A6I0EXG9_9FIRM|nr:YicC/YloC family endoribonuclease [Heliorestis acidaminivorans]KAB2954479.1 YicC family protein [Heliorestis acidaminivorans]
MIKSMTGYGRGEAVGSGQQVTVEVKAVNHRYSEVVVRIPRTYMSLEEAIKKQFQKGVSRGRVDVFVNIEQLGEVNGKVKVDKNLALQYYQSLKELAEELSLPSDFSVHQFINLPEVITLTEEEEDLEALSELASKAAQKALDSLLSMRINEGTVLYEDLLNRIELIKDLTEKIKERAPLLVGEYRQKLQERLKEYLDQIPVDEQRVAIEVALFADRVSITEELVRLWSHLEQFEKALNLKEPVGRKLDFIIQEMNREVNTIGSKANDLEISRHVVNFKSELEKIREQVQNVE